jgi:hypothetical protein
MCWAGWLPGAFAQDKSAGAGGFSGTVIETTNAASYTYMRLDTGKERIWAAAPQFPVKVGEKVSFSDGMPMKDFESKTLNRKFDVVYFVGRIDGPGTGSHAATEAESQAMPKDATHAGLRQPEGVRQASQAIPNDAAHAGLHPPASAAAKPPAKIDFSGIKKADGGLTVAEVYQQKAKLEKKQVTFRGKVVKYNAQVMNKNWAHVQDGTGTPGANDITVTTADAAQTGDTVLVRGTIVLNKDYGYGYKYDLVVEDAKISVEGAK